MNFRDPFVGKTKAAVDVPFRNAAESVETL